MKKEKSIQFNIFFVILLLITAVTTTYAWIKNVKPIVAQLIEYKQGMIISPASIGVRLEYSEAGEATIINNDKTKPMFKLGNMVPGKMYNFYLYISNNGNEMADISIYLDGIHAEENENGVTLLDQIWFRVQMLEGYDTNMMPPSPEFIKLNDSERLMTASTTWSYELVKSASIKPSVVIDEMEGTKTEAKFLLSIMIDTEADSDYENCTLTIDNLRVDN